MTDDVKNERNAKSARNERLKSALRDNLKRRKSQARGRAGMAIVTPMTMRRRGTMHRARAHIGATATPDQPPSSIA